MKRILIAFCLSLIILPAVVVVGLIAATLFAGLPSSAGGTLDSGRSIKTTSDSWYLSLGTSGDTATIQTSGRTIVVSKSAISVDGTNVADIDEKAANVEVNVKRGVITFVADGSPVATTAH